MSRLAISFKGRWLRLIIIELSVALIAIVFVVLAVYMITTLKSAKASLDQANQTLVRIQEKLDIMSGESEKLIRNTNRLTEDLHGQIRSLNGLFTSVREVSESIQEVTSSFRQVSSTVSKSVVNNVEQAVSRNQKKMADLTEWAVFAFRLWQKWKQARNEAESTASQNLDKGEDHHVR